MSFSFSFSPLSFIYSIILLSKSLGHYSPGKETGMSFLPFFKYPKAVRKLIYTTNPIESLNSIIKIKTKQKGSFPSKEAAFKILFTSTQKVMERWKSSRIRN
jgi:transposase-like protein